jgi:tRNA pseudouridine55 synthase
MNGAHKNTMNGILIIDKPAGFTSHDVVARARRILHERSIGHLGTLDPMATGVLPLVIGNLTRLAQFYTSCEKTYEGTVRFGFATDTYDAEGEVLAPAQPVNVSLPELQELARKFVGVIAQTPPPFSAKKNKGVPAYKLARKKQEVFLQSVEVEIKEFEIVALDYDRAIFRARVASGTYIRSIAHDMGQQLGCGAHLELLRRTSVGEFGVADAHSFDEIESATNSESVDDLLIHPRKLLPEFPSVTANEEMAARIRSGQTVNLPELSKARLVKVFEGQRELLAIATRVAGTLFHAKIVLASGGALRFEKSQP